MLNFLKYYLSGLLLFLFVSCSQEQVVDESDACSPYESVHVSAGMPLTRMTTDDGGDVVHFLWERGDLITLATADQQLPYVTNSDGASVTFHTAFGSAAQHDDVLKNMEGAVVYSRYPYNNKKPIDVKSLTTPVTAGSPFLYAIGTILQNQLDLHFHHAMAYLRFHVKHDPFPTDHSLDISASVEVGWSSQEEFVLRGDFDYNSKCINPVETSIDLDIPYLTFMDSLAFFPVAPLSDTSELIFELYCSDADEPQAGQEEFYYRKEITKQLPTNGLQAGHVYDVYLDYRENAGDAVEEEPLPGYNEEFSLMKVIFDWTEDVSYDGNWIKAPAKESHATIYFGTNAKSMEETGITLYYNVEGEEGGYDWSGKAQYEDEAGDKMGMQISGFTEIEGGTASITFTIPSNTTGVDRMMVYGLASGTTTNEEDKCKLLYKFTVSQAAE